MVKKTFLLRLLLDGIAAVLLLVALAYYWLGNAAHEWIGSSIFVLITMHNSFNLRWYGALAKTRREARSLVDVVLTLALLTCMLALLLTSVMLSRTVLGFLHIDGGFSVRQIHLFAAYWSLVLVAMHIGLRWQRVMHAMGNAFQIDGESVARTAALRLTAAALAAYGLHSSFAMGVASKLSLQMSLEWWDFEESVAGFFLHWISIVGLYACVSYYAAGWVQKRKRRLQARKNLGQSRA